MHLLKQFNTLLHEDLSAALRKYLGPRRSPLLRLGEVRLQRLSGGLRMARWLHYPTEQGRIGFHADRPVLLNLLACRYGAMSPGASETPDEAPPETTTEERLFHTLGQVLVKATLARIGAGLGDGKDNTDATPLTSGQSMPPAIGAWLLKTPVHAADDSLVGHVLLTLDEQCMDTVLEHLSPQRHATVRAPSPDLPQALRLQLHARLLEKQMLLGQVLDLKPGHVIPVRLGNADVRIGESVVFRAAVAEHKGKLCLTSFEEE